jgi:formate hydrogenlyase subunit 6/NADH:ubiquinone oxidoreductase subunit I
MTDNEAYERLAERLRDTWYGLPQADEVMPLLKAHHTPGEASLLAAIPFGGNNLEDLAEITGIEAADLKPRLDALAGKGALFRTVTPETTRYSLNDAMFVYLRSAFWAGGTDETTRSIAPIVNQYYYHGFFEPYEYTHIKGLRVLPIQETIKDTRQILTYEEASAFLGSQDYFAVSHCACRHRKNVDPDSASCEHGTENCLHFGRLGRYTVENGLGREITRAEAARILEQSAEAGLVHGISNYQEGADTICNCCRCCCLWMEAFHVLEHQESLTPSSYRVRNDPATCRACELCVERCPMGALRMEASPQATNRKGQAPVLNPELCIGCGVCAYKCPTKSLALEKQAAYTEPPKDARDYARRVVADFQAGHARKKAAASS